MSDVPAHFKDDTEGIEKEMAMDSDLVRTKKRGRNEN